MITGQHVTYTGTIRDKEARGQGTIVAWMQGQGPYAIIQTPAGRFVTADLNQIEARPKNEVKL